MRVRSSLDDGALTAMDQLMFAMAVAGDAVRAVGPDRDRHADSRSDLFQPVHINRGEQIARTLGCDSPLDHRMFVPGHTLWTGECDGLEVQVRSALRQMVAR